MNIGDAFGIILFAFILILIALMFALFIENEKIGKVVCKMLLYLMALDGIFFVFLIFCSSNMGGYYII